MALLKRSRPLQGVYDKPFWDYVESDELRLQRCSSCQHLRYPPSPVCSRCLSDDYTWVEVSGKGKIVSWAIFHRKYLDLPVPYIVISVALDEGPMLIGNIEADPALLRLDLPVRAKFEDAVDDDGQTWRIVQWRLID